MPWCRTGKSSGARHDRVAAIAKVAILLDLRKEAPAAAAFVLVGLGHRNLKSRSVLGSKVIAGQPRRAERHFGDDRQFREIKLVEEFASFRRFNVVCDDLGFET